jgi:hypothetical protein
MSPASSRRRSVSFGTVGASFATREISPRTIVTPSAHRFTASNLALHSCASRSAARREERVSSAAAAPGARRPTLGICAKCERANAEGVGARSMVPLWGQEGGGKRRTALNAAACTESGEQEGDGGASNSGRMRVQTLLRKHGGKTAAELGFADAEAAHITRTFKDGRVERATA